MLSSISSYIWGDSGSEEPLVQAAQQPVVTATTGPVQLPATAATAADELSPVTEDWVLVGGHPPAPGNLTGAAAVDLADIAMAAATATPSSTPNNTTTSSSASSEADEDELHHDGGDQEVVRPAQIAQLQLTAGHLGQEEAQPTPRTAVRSVVQPATQLKSLKSAQICRQRNSGKALSSKSLNRSNKAVRRESIKYNMSIKSAGFNKNLKQC